MLSYYANDHLRRWIIMAHIANKYDPTLAN